MELKRKKGITLIALVITIIVLLILAGVAVSIGLDGGGVFSRANNTVVQWNAKVAAEENAITKIWKKTNNEKTKIGETLKAGDWVEYSGDESEYSTNKELAGVEQTLVTDNSVKWRVLKVDDENVTIIPSKHVCNLGLFGSSGYLNGPDIINEACKNLYKNSSLGVSDKDIRNINYDDIEKMIDVKKEESTYYMYNTRSNKWQNWEYGEEISLESGQYFYEYEENGEVIVSNTPKSASTEQPVKVKITAYIVDNSDSAPRGLRFNWLEIENANKPGLKYGDLFSDLLAGWVAERCLGPHSLKSNGNPTTIQYMIATMGKNGLNRIPNGWID